jgi:hypothetical protein
MSTREKDHSVMYAPGVDWSGGAKRASVLWALMLLPGCYESEVALDPSPQQEVDAAVIGSWRCLPLDADADEEPATVTVKRGSDRLYGVEWQEGTKPPDRYEAFASSVGGAVLVNVQEIKGNGERGRWVYLRYALLRPNVLHLQVVSDEAMKGVEKSRAAIRAVIERRSEQPLYQDFCVCARAKPVDPPSR